MSKKILVSGGKDSTVRVWNLVNGRNLHIFTGHQVTSDLSCVSVYCDVSLPSQSCKFHDSTATTHLLHEKQNLFEHHFNFFSILVSVVTTSRLNYFPANVIVDNASQY